MMAAVVTAVLALLIFVLTQSFLKLLLEPVQEQRRLIGEVAHALLFYANVIQLESVRVDDERGKRAMMVGARQEELEESRKALRGLAGRLRASLWFIPFYDVLASVGLVPKLADVLEASSALVGWSNSLSSDRHGEANRERRKVIGEKLGISKRVGPT